MSFPDYIDGNRIISEISSGGHAIVYKAWDATLEKYYAIKLMKLDAAENADRFLTEAKVLAQLDHPNIPHIYNYGKHENRPFLKMDFVDGNDLGIIIQEKGKIPLQVTCAIILQVARALKYAHNHDYEIYGEKRHGIIHRDIKPQNIMINKEGQVKLIDFGIVKVANLSKHTIDDVLIGTPHYMSPEQHLATIKEPVDRQSDIYSLGCVMFECLTGQCQFEADSISSMLDCKEENNYNYDLLLKHSINIRKIVKKATEPTKENRFKRIDEFIKQIEKQINRDIARKPEGIVKEYLLHDTIERSFKGIRTAGIITLSIILIGLVVYSLSLKNRKNSNDSSEIVVSEINKRDSIEIGGNDEKTQEQISTTIETVEKVQINPKMNTTSIQPSVKEIDKDITVSMPENGDITNTIINEPNVSELSDSSFLEYCGKLLETDIRKLGEFVFMRNVEDGYLEYLRGRYLYSKNMYDTSNERFLKSLTKKTVFSFDEQVYYYLAVCSYNIYKGKPNVANRGYYENRIQDYIRRYCENGYNGAYCDKIQSIYVK